MGVSWALEASVCFSILSSAVSQTLLAPNTTKADASIVMPPAPGLSSDCKFVSATSLHGEAWTNSIHSSTFSTVLACEPRLTEITFHGAFPTNQDLGSLCASDCLQTLSALQVQQQQACSSDTMVLGNQVYPVTSTVDSLLWAYNYICHKDKTGQLCWPIFDSWANGQRAQDTCTDCVLGTYQLSLKNSLRYNDEAAASLALLASSCQSTGYALTSPPSLTVSRITSSSATTTAPVKSTASCHSTYTVAEADDCHSISKAQNASTANMLYLNNLQTGCANFAKPGTQLCMPHACDVHTIQPDESCWSVVQDHGNTFTVSQLIAWNIDLNAGCSNLEMLVGNQICISYPGEALEAVPASAQDNVAAPAPTNVANRTNTQCSKYYTVQAGDTCAAVTQAQGISLKDFYFLNPMINSTTCSNLELDLAYCVKAVGNIWSYPGYDGMPDNPCLGGTTTGPSSCYATTYQTMDYWTFPRVDRYYGNNTTTRPTVSYNISDSTVTRPTAINPSITSTVPITSCSSKPFPADSFTASSSSASLSSAGLSYVSFSSIGFSSAGASSVSSSSVSSSSVLPTAPGPTQSGQPADCSTWILPRDGEYCAGMASRASIALACLYHMNPALNTSGECHGLWTGYAYCANTASDVCK